MPEQTPKESSGSARRLADLDEAIHNVFATMFACDMRLRRSIDECAEAPHIHRGLTVAVEFSAPCAGSCRLHIDAVTARALCRQLTGGEDQELVEDTARELCNMIAGGWKSMQPAAHGAMTPPVLLETPVAAGAGWRSYAETPCAFCVKLEVAPEN